MQNNPSGDGEGAKGGLLLPHSAPEEEGEEEDREKEDKSKLSPPPSYKAVVYSSSRGVYSPSLGNF